jgi:cell division protein FtsQ
MRRRLLLAVLVALALAGLYHFWLRDSSLVAVNDVQVTGLTTKDGPRIQAMLESIAEDMTTLHVQKDEFEEAVRTFPVVGSLHVEADFPHGLLIEVTERPAAALVEVDGVPTPVAADGTILRGLRVPEGLPQVRMEKPVSENHVTDPAALRALLVAGAAPEGFPQRIERVSEDSEHGIVLALEDGPDLFFGDADLVTEKWTAAVRVMADADAAGRRPGDGGRRRGRGQLHRRAPPRATGCGRAARRDDRAGRTGGGRDRAAGRADRARGDGSARGWDCHAGNDCRSDGHDRAHDDDSGAHDDRPDRHSTMSRELA